MEMMNYIAAIQRKLITQYGFAEHPDRPGIPAHVPDGHYPMEIDGRTDSVRIINGQIHCCNFEGQGA